MQSSFRSRIEIPARLQQSLALEQALGADIQGVVEQFSIWLSRNQTVFFPEYTDHGIDHVTNVLISAEQLIPEASWRIVTGADAAAIVVSVLLHDCAMHLTLDGFFELIEGKAAYKESRIHSAARRWAEEFHVFQQEAARWDAQRLISVFGDQSPAELLSKGERDVSDRQKLLIGEFFRRHHARLAHQIAINWVPGAPGAERFSPLSGLNDEFRDLFGFLALSHNIPIRTAADTLQPIRRRTYLGVHAPFVMAILRIADYIQIDAARAPTQILQLRGLKSPISRREWAKHHAVLELHHAGDDPEALNVIANPSSVEIFSGLRLLFRDLQRELDESWATLGEVYGRFDDLKGLGLTVRRLVSNLDDSTEFEKRNKPAYIPRELRMSTATAELLDLLVGPLYGNRPSVGVRELLQNSIDAVLERQSFSQRHAPSVQYDPLIRVDLINDEGSRALEISDNGIGMTLDTIEDYFLRAGASFRRSQWWKSEFLQDGGSSIVRRSGRFGVGVLAAFLIGRKILVTTRHFKDTSGMGLRFGLTMDGSLVEVMRVRADVGTSIRIEFNDEHTVNALMAKENAGESIVFFDWYRYKSPNIKYRVLENSSWHDKKCELQVCSPLISKNSPWTLVEVDGFDGVYWSYDKHSRTDSILDGLLICNGIFIANDGYRSEFPVVKVLKFAGGYQTRHPALLVEDPNGRLPLTIQRGGLAEDTYPFQGALEKSIAAVYARTFHLALRIPSTPEHLGDAVKAVGRALRPFHSASARASIGLSTRGWVPLDESLLAEVRPKVIAYEMFLRGEFTSGISKINPGLYDGMLMVPWLSDGGAYSPIQFLRELVDDSRYWRGREPYSTARDNIVGFRFFVRNDIKERLQKKGGLPKFILREFRDVLELDGWTVYDMGGDVFPAKDAAAVIDLVSPTDGGLLAFVAYSDSPQEQSAPALSPFGEEWIQMVPSMYLAVTESS